MKMNAPRISESIYSWYDYEQHPCDMRKWLFLDEDLEAIDKKRWLITSDRGIDQQPTRLDYLLDNNSLRRSNNCWQYSFKQKKLTDNEGSQGCFNFLVDAILMTRWGWKREYPQFGLCVMISFCETLGNSFPKNICISGWTLARFEGHNYL